MVFISKHLVFVALLLAGPALAYSSPRSAARRELSDDLKARALNIQRRLEQRSYYLSDLAPRENESLQQSSSSSSSAPRNGNNGQTTNRDTPNANNNNGAPASSGPSMSLSNNAALGSNTRRNTNNNNNNAQISSLNIPNDNRAAADSRTPPGVAPLDFTLIPNTQLRAVGVQSGGLASPTEGGGTHFPLTLANPNVQPQGAGNPQGLLSPAQTPGGLGNGMGNFGSPDLGITIPADRRVFSPFSTEQASRRLNFGPNVQNANNGQQQQQQQQQSPSSNSNGQSSSSNQASSSSSRPITTQKRAGTPESDDEQSPNGPSSSSKRTKK